MRVNAEGLKDWPDNSAIEGGAEALQDSGANFFEAVGAARNIWRELSAHYWTDGAEQLYRALDHPADVSADVVSKGATFAAGSLIGFAKEVEKLKIRAYGLEDLALQYNSELALLEEDVCKEGSEGVDARRQEAKLLPKAKRLQATIDGVVSDYEAAIEACASRLDELDEHGLPVEGSSAWTEFFVDLGIDVGVSGVRAVATAWVVDTFTTTINKYERGPNGELVPRGPNPTVTYTDTRNRLDWRRLIETGNNWKEETRRSRFGRGLKPLLLGPPSRVEHHPSATRVVGGPDVYHSGRVTHTTAASNVGRALGRGLGAVGSVLLVASEYQQADERLKEERPDLTDSQRTAHAAGTAAARAGAQIAVAAAAGAAIGSVVPVAGTGVGLAIGLAVGVAMSIPIGDDKSIGDRIGDVGEGAFNLAVDLFSSPAPQRP